MSNYLSNPVLDKLPAHLRQFIKPQDYDSYTAKNQAVWRYVMRKNVDYLSTVAHPSYVNGLKKTGISTEAIPNMYGMNRILKEIGWAAVAVDGFIPPAAFMEFQAYNVLVIASDIRQLENINYTPAPDIIHEAAGHAPIIANPEYAEYLRRFGEIGSKAISSAKDYELYNAVRHLSIIKEAGNTPKAAIDAAEAKIIHLQENMGAPSEMALIRNLHWWTVEYGLIGNLKQPKIYGAGLLSSIGESAWCLTDKVKKVPYTLAAAKTPFDITKPQPQLFVTPNFPHLSQVLEDFADTMALRSGGLSSLEKVIASKSLATIELSTGLQVSGHFTDLISHQGKPIYFRTNGPTALAYREKELVGHGLTAHPSGFGSPIGKLQGINLAIENMTPRDLKAYNIFEGEKIALSFEGGLKIEGEIITGTRNLKGEIILITFKNCTVTHNGTYLFLPEWGLYHMAVGKKLVAAFNGPADLNSFDLSAHKINEKTKTQDSKKNNNTVDGYYQKLRQYRAGKLQSLSLTQFYEQTKQHFSTNWLLGIELYELAIKDAKPQLAATLKNELLTIKQQHPKIATLITDGLWLAGRGKP